LAKTMKEKLLDVIKWCLFITIGAVIFYFVYPKYKFVGSNIRMNKITGTVERFESGKQQWIVVGKKGRKGINKMIVESGEKVKSFTSKILNNPEKQSQNLRGVSIKN